MARPSGTPNPKHGERRAELLARIRTRLLEPSASYASVRELAKAASVGVPTLTHYFGKRDDIIAALLMAFGEEGAEHLSWTRAVDLPFEKSIDAYVFYAAAGFKFGLSVIHTLGLREGLRHERLGPAYLSSMLDPAINSLADRLAVHQTRAEMISCDPRHAAIGLLSPIIIVSLHQSELYGALDNPVDVDQLLKAHVDAFVRAYRKT